MTQQTRQMQLDPEDQRKIFGILRVLFPTAKLYLFGSRARGDAHKFSDVDIAIDEGKLIELHRVGEIKAMFEESNFMFRFDIVDMHEISPELLEHIKKDGILWHN